MRKGRIKEKLYYYFVEKNKWIKEEYDSYVEANYEEHKSKRWKHWWVLFRLNWHYRVLRKTNTLLDFDTVFKNENKNISILKKENKNSSVLKKENKSVLKKESKNNSVVIPYMDGLESEKRKNRDAYAFARGLMKYDVISFDIFDTLILRKVNDPADLFMILGEKLDIFDFYSLRKKAEKEVRDRNAVLYGCRECTINEIYERISYWTGLDVEYGINLELETELQFCKPNPFMMHVYQILKSAGKKIYATSNMYLPLPMMERLLKNCGYHNFEEILVSCDCHCSKTNGALFEILKNKISGKSIVHIGDNPKVDVEGAKKANIDFRYYQSCASLGMPHRSRGMSPLVASAYYAMVNNRFHNGAQMQNRNSIFWEYGYVYGGIIALGYVNWIHEQAKREGKDKILFLARDGYVLKQVYDMMFDDIPSEYFFWSRISGIRATSKGTRFQLLNRVFTETANKGISISRLLKLANLEKMESEFVKNGIDTSWPLITENATLVKDILVKNWDKIEEILNISRNYIKEYLSESLKGFSKIGIVDIGWTGKNIENLKSLMVECGISKNDITVYLLGCLGKVQNPSEILKDELKCYIFSSNNNRQILEQLSKESAKALEYIEKMFTAPHASFLGFDLDGKMEFASPEIDNFEMYTESAEGIIDFCTEFYHEYKDYSYIMNISGHDAYIPYQLLLDNREYTKKVFDKLSLNTTIVPDCRKNMKSIINK